MKKAIVLILALLIVLSSVGCDIQRLEDPDVFTPDYYDNNYPEELDELDESDVELPAVVIESDVVGFWLLEMTNFSIMGYAFAEDGTGYFFSDRPGLELAYGDITDLTWHVEDGVLATQWINDDGTQGELLHVYLVDDDILLMGAGFQEGEVPPPYIADGVMFVQYLRMTPLHDGEDFISMIERTMDERSAGFAATNESLLGTWIGYVDDELRALQLLPDGSGYLLVGAELNEARTELTDMMIVELLWSASDSMLRFSLILFDTVSGDPIYTPYSFLMDELYVGQGVYAYFEPMYDGESFESIIRRVFDEILVDALTGERDDRFVGEWEQSYTGNHKIFLADGRGHWYSMLGPLDFWWRTDDGVITLDILGASGMPFAALIYEYAVYADRFYFIETDDDGEPHRLDPYVRVE